MIIELTTGELEFLQNILIERSQDSNLRQQDGNLPLWIAAKLDDKVVELTQQEVEFSQWLLQGLSEIHGRRSSTANEKKSLVPNPFIPQPTLQLVKSISTKLGAKLVVDIETRSNQLSPRGEGSTWIMTDVTKKHI